MIEYELKAVQQGIMKFIASNNEIIHTNLDIGNPLEWATTPKAIYLIKSPHYR
jgi:hypothetical protein